MVAKRTTVHKRSAYNQKIPYNRTLTAVYDSVLEDLLLPGFIVARRMRVRSDGTHLYKVFANEASRKVLEERTEIIENLYKALTNRKLAIDFKIEDRYCQIP